MKQLIDFHTHVLPGIDDGSRSMEDTLSMLRMEKEQGVAHVVATPHFYPQSDKPERFLARRAAAVERLEEALADDPSLPRVTVGAEVHYFRGISSTDILPELSIGKGRYILIEMPSGIWSDTMYNELEGIYSKKGLIPIIAHIDRYISRFSAGKIMRRLEEMPVLIQANAEFFRQRSTAGLAMKMLRQEQIHLLGTDCHNLSSRKPNMADAVASIQKHLGDGALEHVFDTQEAIFQGVSR